MVALTKGAFTLEVDIGRQLVSQMGTDRSQAFEDHSSAELAHRWIAVAF